MPDYDDALEDNDDEEEPPKEPPRPTRTVSLLAEASNQILEDSKKYLTTKEQQPAYVGSVRTINYHALLYFDTGSTGTRPYVFMYKSGEKQLSEFWALTRSKEFQTITIHNALQGAQHDNEELLKKFATASDEKKIELLEGLSLSDDFIQYISGTMTQATKIVNKWMAKEQEKGVTFYSDDSALLISDVIIAITGGLRSILGESAKVSTRLNAHLTACITNKLREAYALNGARLTAQLFTGTEEALCEAAAVSVLAGMHGSIGDKVGVVSMGGASVQISAGASSISVSVARKAGIAAAEAYIKGDKNAIEDFTATFNKALQEALKAQPDMLLEPRTWVGMSGMFYTAKDLSLTLETVGPIASVQSNFKELMQPLMVAGQEKRLGSAVAFSAVLSNLLGQVMFQREWTNPKTNQKLAATVSTGYVVRKLGYVDC